MESLNRKFKIGNNHFDLIITFEGERIAKTYDPHSKEDIESLSRIANIDEFIHEKNKKKPELLIFENNRYNRGVVTNQTIKKNQTICKYLGEIGSIDKAINKNRIKKSLLNAGVEKFSEKTIDSVINSYIKRVTDYAFELTEKPSAKDTVLAHNKRSLAAFINHNSTDPNVKAHIINNTIYYKAARDIYKGEQLIIDYGPDYDYHDQLYYIPSTENHLNPGQFLADHFEFYHPQPIELTATQKMYLRTKTNTLMIPKFLYKLLYRKKKKTSSSFKLNEFEKRLPLIEVVFSTPNKSCYAIHVLENQQNITPLIFSATVQNAEAVSTLVNQHKVDIFAKTLHDLDALIIAIKASDSEKDFIKIAKPIVKKFGPLLGRMGVIGSDNLSKTALHMLVDLEWTRAITYFDHMDFFELIDDSNYDPLIASIAYGKTKALSSLLKLSCVKKCMYELLLSDDEHKNELVLMRALKDTPSEKYDEVIAILRKAINRRPVLKKKLRHLIC